MPLKDHVALLKKRIGLCEFAFLTDSLITGTLPPWSEISRQDAADLLSVVLLHSKIRHSGGPDAFFLELIKLWY
jgi:hypothetical protein